MVRDRDWAQTKLKPYKPGKDSDDDEPRGWVFLPEKGAKGKTPTGWVQLVDMVKDRVSKVLVETEPMTLSEAAQIIGILCNLTTAGHNARDLDKSDDLADLILAAGDDDDDDSDDAA